MAALLDELASEVRRQLANKHTQSPWAPRDLVRFTTAFAALEHRTPRATQMLDSLSSFCVQVGVGRGGGLRALGVGWGACMHGRQGRPQHAR